MPILLWKEWHGSLKRGFAGDGLVLALLHRKDRNKIFLFLQAKCGQNCYRTCQYYYGRKSHRSLQYSSAGRGLALTLLYADLCVRLRTSVMEKAKI